MATIAAELAPEIRVNAVAPGWVDTHMNDEVFADKDFREPISEGLQTFTALQRRGVPSRLLYFPDERHFILKPLNSQLWYETVHEWLAMYLR